MEFLEKILALLIMFREDAQQKISTFTPEQNIKTLEAIKTEIGQQTNRLQKSRETIDHTSQEGKRQLKITTKELRDLFTIDAIVDQQIDNCSKPYSLEENNKTTFISSIEAIEQAIINIRRLELGLKLNNLGKELNSIAGTNPSKETIQEKLFDLAHYGYLLRNCLNHAIRASIPVEELLPVSFFASMPLQEALHFLDSSLHPNSDTYSEETAEKLKEDFDSIASRLNLKDHPEFLKDVFMTLFEVTEGGKITLSEAAERRKNKELVSDNTNKKNKTYIVPNVNPVEEDPNSVCWHISAKTALKSHGFSLKPGSKYHDILRNFPEYMTRQGILVNRLFSHFKKLDFAPTFACGLDKTPTLDAYEYALRKYGALISIEMHLNNLGFMAPHIVTIKGVYRDESGEGLIKIDDYVEKRVLFKDHLIIAKDTAFFTPLLIATYKKAFKALGRQEDLAALEESEKLYQRFGNSPLHFIGASEGVYPNPKPIPVPQSMYITINSLNQSIALPGESGKIILPLAETIQQTFHIALLHELGELYYKALSSLYEKTPRLIELHKKIQQTQNIKNEEDFVKNAELSAEYDQIIDKPSHQVTSAKHDIVRERLVFETMNKETISAINEKGHLLNSLLKELVSKQLSPQDCLDKYKTYLETKKELKKLIIQLNELAKNHLYDALRYEDDTLSLAYHCAKRVQQLSSLTIKKLENLKKEGERFEKNFSNEELADRLDKSRFVLRIIIVDLIVFQEEYTNNDTRFKHIKEEWHVSFSKKLDTYIQQLKLVVENLENAERNLKSLPLSDNFSPDHNDYKKLKAQYHGYLKTLEKIFSSCTKATHDYIKELTTKYPGHTPPIETEKNTGNKDWLTIYDTLLAAFHPNNRRHIEDMLQSKKLNNLKENNNKSNDTQNSDSGSEPQNSANQAPHSESSHTLEKDVEKLTKSKYAKVVSTDPVKRLEQHNKLVQKLRDIQRRHGLGEEQFKKLYKLVTRPYLNPHPNKKIIKEILTGKTKKEVEKQSKTFEVFTPEKQAPTIEWAYPAAYPFEQGPDQTNIMPLRSTEAKSSGKTTAHPSPPPRAPVSLIAGLGVPPMFLPGQQRPFSVRARYWVRHNFVHNPVRMQKLASLSKGAGYVNLGFLGAHVAKDLIHLGSDATRTEALKSLGYTGTGVAGFYGLSRVAPLTATYLGIGFAGLNIATLPFINYKIADWLSHKLTPFVVEYAKSLEAPKHYCNLHPDLSPYPDRFYKHYMAKKPVVKFGVLPGSDLYFTTRKADWDPNKFMVYIGKESHRGITDNLITQVTKDKTLQITSYVVLPYATIKPEQVIIEGKTYQWAYYNPASAVTGDTYWTASKEEAQAGMEALNKSQVYTVGCSCHTRPLIYPYGLNEPTKGTTLTIQDNKVQLTGHTDRTLNALIQEVSPYRQKHDRAELKIPYAFFYAKSLPMLKPLFEGYAQKALMIQE